MNDFNEIFSEIKKLMKSYEPPFAGIAKGDEKYELYSIKSMEVFGKKVTELYLASVVIQKNFVGFYYLPLYFKPEIKDELKPELLKLLKGKTCFHIKKLDETIIEQLRELLDNGVEYYKKMNWMKD